MTAHKTLDLENGRLFYRNAGCDIENPKGCALLLHGMRFSSSNWEEIKTMEKLVSLGYRAIALDLPGYGNSKDFKEPSDTGQFLAKVIKKLSLKKPVVISPSMSGGYSLPLLHEHGSSMKAFIPIAPVKTESYSKVQYGTVKVPTFIVYGENDRMLGEISLKNLKQIPGNTIYKMRNAGHACYLDKPDEWHEILEEILLKL